jgi:hypothetical protein
MRTSVLELAKEVDRKQAELDRAKAALLAALAGTTPNGSNLRGLNVARSKPQRGPGSESIAARVLSLVERAGPQGIQRQALVQELGGSSVASAVHSALKKYSGLKRMFSRDGNWVAAQYQAPARSDAPEAVRPKTKAPKATSAKGAK